MFVDNWFRKSIDIDEWRNINKESEKKEEKRKKERTKKARKTRVIVEVPFFHEVHVVLLLGEEILHSLVSLLALLQFGLQRLTAHPVLLRLALQNTRFVPANNSLEMTAPEFQKLALQAMEVWASQFETSASSPPLLSTWLQIWFHNLLWGDSIRKGADLEKQNCLFDMHPDIIEEINISLLKDSEKNDKEKLKIDTMTWCIPIL